MSYDGIGIPKNVTNAFKYYRTAADLGHAKAQSNIGVMYEKGIGVKVDLSLAREMYHRSALQGNAVAQSNLGHLYYRGVGVKVDLVETYVWWKLASDGGAQDAKGNLAILHRELSPRQREAALVKAEQVRSSIRNVLLERLKTLSN
jgi:hypothetical protein